MSNAEIIQAKGWIIRLCFIGLAILLIPLGPHSLMAQSDPCARRTVPISVSNSDNQLLTGLSSDNFQASLRRHPIKILSVTPNDKPVRVIIILDASGSMGHDAKIWQAYITLAEKVLERLPTSTLVGFMVFNDHVKFAAPLSMNRAVIMGQLEQLRSQRIVGPTALLDTLRVAAFQFDPPMPGDSIYAITDGDDDASRIRPDIVEEDLVARGIRLFAFAIKPKEYAPSQMHFASRLAEATGGHSILIPSSRAELLAPIGKVTSSPDDDLALLSRQIQLISSFARVELELPEALHKSEKWDLRTIGITGPDLLVDFPHNLAPCPVKSGH